MDDMRRELLAALGYSDKAIMMLDQEPHYGKIEDATVHMKHQAGCGDILFLDLRMEDDRITDAGYQFVGCSGLQASASALTEMIIGKRVADVESLSMQDIVDWLGGIPVNKYECAEAAAITLHKAINAWRDGPSEN